MSRQKENRQENKQEGAQKMPPHGGKRKLDVKVLLRVLKMLYHYYPKMIPIAVACIVFSAVASAIPAIFLEKVTTAMSQKGGKVRARRMRISR